MKDLTAGQHLLRLLIVATVVAVTAAGIALLPVNDYQPSRPLYAAAWLFASAAVYLWLRSKHAFGASVAFVLIWLYAAVLIATVFM